MADLVSSIYELLGGKTSPNNGVTYGLSDGNNVDELLTTPNLWGHNPAVDDYEPAGQNLVDAIRGLVSKAAHSVDISTLYSIADPFPTGLFLDAIRDGIHMSAKAGRKFAVRILVGAQYVRPIVALDKFLSDLQIPDGIPVYVGVMQSDLVSWNHSKLIIVDGKSAIAGGHNLWSDTYCGFAPVHDVSLRLSGPAVAVAQAFLNVQWSVVARYSRTADVTKRYWSEMYLDKRHHPNALPVIKHAVPAATGSTRVLSLARMGSKLVPSNHNANASREARIAAVYGAQKHIRLSQQMLGSRDYGGVDDRFFHALCQQVVNGIELTLIISDDGATNSSGAPYSGYGVAKTAELIASEVRRITGKSGDELLGLLKDRVRIGPVRIYDKQPGDPDAKSWKWRKDKAVGEKVIEPGNHAKVYIIDEQAYYVGSDNAYAIPTTDEGLQEFGFLISGEDETKKFLGDYWDKFWKYSSQFQFTDWKSLVGTNNGALQ